MKSLRSCLTLLLVNCLSSAATINASETQRIITGKDVFEFTYKITIPSVEGKGRLWLPIASSDRHQKVDLLGVTTQRPWRLIKDERFGNKVFTMQLGKGDSGGTVEMRYRVERREKTAYRAGKEEDVTQHLEAEALVPKDKRLADIAREVIKDAPSAKAKGEALYRHTLNRMAYDKTGTGWGRGDALFACDSRTGNCTDFHAYFIGLARSVDIPARFAIGFTIPADRSDGEIGGYHCWAEYFADGKWHPVDISEADKHPELADYYLGRHPANRFQMTLGRDLKTDPAPASGPINYLVYPIAEVDGEQIQVEREFQFKRIVN